MSSSSWRLLLMTATAAAMCLAVPRAVHAAPDSMVTPERPANSPGVHLFHMSWRGARDDRRAHIPGATHFDTNRIERPPLWRLVPDVDLERTMLELGVTRT